MAKPLKVRKSTQAVGDVEVSVDIMVPVPEHDKLRLVADKSQAIGDFLEWSRMTLCLPHHHAPSCRLEARGPLLCGYRSGEFEPVRTPVRALLADYFGIDEGRLEAEKVALLEAIRR